MILRVPSSPFPTLRSVVDAIRAGSIKNAKSQAIQVVLEPGYVENVVTCLNLNLHGLHIIGAE